MIVSHEIDQQQRIILTVCVGEATGDDLLDAMLHYQQNIKSEDRYKQYNELVDFRQLKVADISSESLRKVGEISQQAASDHDESRVAFLVDSPLVFGLARMYISYRTLLAKKMKEMRVFRKEEDARAWLKE